MVCVPCCTITCDVSNHYYLQEVAQKLIQSTILSDESGRPLNPLDAHFLSLGLSSMEPVKRDTKEFTMLEKYAKDTHGATHSHYRVNIAHVFRVERSVISASVITRY